LIGLLRDEEPVVRGAAAQALGQTQDARALTELDWLTQEDDGCIGQLIRVGDIAARAASQIRASLA
jgi:HEAT repeat protein